MVRVQVVFSRVVREKADFSGFVCVKADFCSFIKTALCGVLQISAGECGICGIVSCHGASLFTCGLTIVNIVA